MSKYDISAFYFPNFHKGDKHNEKWHGSGWTEWNLMKNATPRFEGHKIPVPYWGYEDESEIPVMEKKIATAKEFGITNLIFDWYWYADGPFLNKPLEQAFLKAKNSSDVKFSLMWANHDWIDIHPMPRAYINNPICELKGQISQEQFYKAFDYIIENYFVQPNYYKLDGGLFFSIYEVNTFVSTFGGVDGARKAVSIFRQKVKDAGLGELHLNAIVWGVKNLPGESAQTAGSDTLKKIGFDSVTSYVWIHEHVIENYPTQNYADFAKVCERDYSALTEKFKGMPYYPNVSCGWDPSPRTCQSDEYGDLGYPFSRILTNNTPEEFEKALRSVKCFLDKCDLKTKMFTINAWNEWTEGSYLEPDEQYGFGRLQAIKNVFNKE